METSVEAAEVLVPPQPDEASTLDPETSGGETAGAPCAAASSPNNLDPMEEFTQRLDDIIHTYGTTTGLLDKQSVMQAEAEKVNDEAKDDITGSMETEVSLIMQSLDELSSPEEKLGALVRKYAELVALRRCDALKLDALQQKLSAVLEERQQLQAEHRSSVAARGKLETLCREQQSFYNVLREETLQRCKEDEEKRTEITTHFQSMLSEIQSQIELHSARNEKLCRENINLTDKLENLMTQCERREESLEKINKHRDLQQKLIEAKLQQANALLAEAEEKHKREKEYLLVQAAEWKLQAQTLREQGTVMQAQLTLYGQKFDEFQETLAKSNEIYVRFKKEMENMSDKMKKVEKESSLWKTRFENCNKALTDMIEERAEKGKEYDLFVLKIQKLEKLCHALQDERKVLYDKIKEVRHSNADLSAKVFGTSNLSDNPEGAETSALITPDELKEMEEEEDQVLTDGMARLKEEQAKLQEFAASLLVTATDNDEEENNELDLDEDLVSSAFFHFKAKPQVRDVPDSVPEQVNDLKSKDPDSELPQLEKVDEVQDQIMPAAEAAATQEATLEISSPEVVKVQTQVETEEVQQVKPDAEIQQPVAPVLKPEPEQVKFEITPEPPVKDENDQQQVIEPTPASEPEKAKAEPQTHPVKAEILEECVEGKPLVPLQDEKVQPQPPESVPTPETEKTEDAEEMKGETLKETGEVKPAVSVDDKAQKQTDAPVHAPEAASEPSESAACPPNTPEAAADSSKKQLPKKKKKKSSKSAS
ncbi:beta-taxilin isoform X1 [Archocentrus centrarchus]|uniref:beta-taxilin isoform X1 n=1 Tax=Archocentrus centrarchus TaxID=63155 RepID=UPI0011EA52F9|nr:beta-taxilin isoform X1 [Archocentrus centrarchus]